MDWVVVQNISNIKNTRLDLETKIKLREHYRKILKEEKKQRNEIENLIRNNQNKYSKV